jgi:four helix bundle protein
MTETVQSYRDLIAWQRAMEIAKKVYVVTAKFPKTEMYALANQMQRAAVSIPSNIAEGQARQHPGEFRHFLHIALGSAAELDTQLRLAIEFGYVSEPEAQPIFDLIVEVRKITYGILRKLPSSTH